MDQPRLGLEQRPDPGLCDEPRRDTWAGGSDEPPPQPLDAVIIFATVGAMVPLALKAVRKGGRVVCAGIHMSDIPSFPYSTTYPLNQANRALADLRAGRFDGAAVLEP
jgi:propanol-preferring alcohol dehydrogenase